MGEMQHKTLAERTADVICDMLYRNNYRVGAKLPNELELARQLEVSRNTVRQAIRILVERNILEVQRGAGTFVSAKLGMSDDPLGLSMILDQKKLLWDLLDVRMMIEPRMAALAAERRTAEEVRQLKDICTRLENACRRGENYYELDMEFHTFVAGCSKNLVVHSLYPAICQMIILQESVIPERMSRDTIRVHRRICDAIAQQRVMDAYDAMAAHLTQNRERMFRYKEKTAKEEVSKQSSAKQRPQKSIG